MNSLDFTRPITHRDSDLTYESPLYCIATGEVQSGTTSALDSDSIIFQ